MKNINMDDFYKKILNKEDMKVIDVRPAHLFEAGHVEQAKNIPLSQLQQSLDQLYPADDYYIICQTGQSSLKACQLLQDEGFQVCNVEGGTDQYPGPLKK